MEFSDTTYAACMFLLCYVLLFVPLHQFLGFTTFLMPNSIITAFLLGGIITGAVFSNKLSSHRVISIGKILLIISVFIVFFVLTQNFIDWTAYQEIYHTTWSAAQWSNQMSVMLYITIALYEAMGLSIIFTGLFVGSLVRRIRSTKEP